MDNVENILAANVNLVATGVAKDATANQLKGFIENKGTKVVEIELLTNHPEARTNTFKIAIKPGDYDKAMNPEVLPYRVGVRTFRHKRQQQNSWANQAGQTGGNVSKDSQQAGGVHDRRPHQQRQHQPRRDSVIETSNPFGALDSEVGRQFN